MTWNLRELRTKDIFPICGILKKIGIKELKTIINSEDMLKIASDKKINIEAVSLDMIIDLVGVIVSNLPNCEKEIYAFLESIIIPEDGQTINRQYLENLSISDFTALVMVVINKDEFKDFFKLALKSSK